MLRAAKPLVSRVVREETLSWIADPLGRKEVPVQAPAAGLVIGRVNLPLVSEGEALSHIARFAETGTAADVVEPCQAAYNPQTDVVDEAEPPISK
jgi:hypothetical protein